MVSGYTEKFKMAEPSDYSCSSSSEDDEYSDPLEVAANKHISKVCFVRIPSRGYRNRKPVQRIIFL